MNAIQGFMEKMGSNFIVAAFIPALAFVTGVMFFMGPLLPAESLEWLRNMLTPLDYQGVILLLLTVILGFVLTSLNTQIYKLFEGYVFSHYLTYFHKREIRRARKLRSEYERIDRQVKMLQTREERRHQMGLPIRPKNVQEKVHRHIQNLEIARDERRTHYGLHYPPVERQILPTRLGNILKAAEAYPVDRYQLDSVTLWPRMVNAVDNAWMDKVDSANNQCSFLLNCALLSFAFAGLSIIAALYELAIYFLLIAGNTQPVYFLTLEIASIENHLQNALLYPFLGLVGILALVFFYNASLWNVLQFGNMIRATYDLFRFNLLRQLHLEEPEDSDEEKLTWKKVSEFMTVGEWQAKIHFDYITTDHSENG